MVGAPVSATTVSNVDGLSCSITPFSNQVNGDILTPMCNVSQTAAAVTTTGSIVGVPCVLLSNVSSLVPSNVMNGGVRLSALGS